MVLALELLVAGLLEALFAALPSELLVQLLVELLVELLAEGWSIDFRWMCEHVLMDVRSCFDLCSWVGGSIDVR